MYVWILGSYRAHKREARANPSIETHSPLNSILQKTVLLKNLMLRLEGGN